MEFVTEKNRIFCAEDGETLAEVTFPDAGDRTVNIDHTYVSEKLRGQGVAGRLMKLTADELRRTGRRAVLTCSYAQKWWDAHEEEADLLIR